MSLHRRAFTITISVDRPADEVATFLRTPSNMPKWAPGFCRAIAQESGQWVAQTAGGPAKVRFAPVNDYGVVDHWVTPNGQAEVHMPLRVVPNDSGAEVMITFYQPVAMSDDQARGDLKLVSSDMERLKGLLENKLN